MGDAPGVSIPADEQALRDEIAALHAQGREQERGEAADRLAALLMARTLPRG